MNYRLTVWNFLIVLLAAYATLILIEGNADPSTQMGAAYLIPILIVGLIIDFILQQLIRNRKVLAIVEAISLATIIIINSLP